MNAQIEAKDLFPQKPTFTLEATGKTHTLRKINVQDYAWMTEKVQGLDQKLSKGQVELGLLCKLLFRLLEDKSDFLPIDEEAYDDEGEKLPSVRVTGPDRLARAIAMGELEQVTQAFNEAMGLKVAEPQEAGEGDKKKEA